MWIPKVTVCIAHILFESTGPNYLPGTYEGREFNLYKVTFVKSLVPVRENQENQEN